MRGIIRNAAALLVFLTLTTGQLKAQNQETEQVVKKCSDAVVLIFVSDSGKETGLGSGFIISPDGKIVTNYHVIKDAAKALVKLTNGAFFPVESVLVSDSTQDLAIVKVAARNLPTLKMADSDTVRVGERVVAIGSPLGLEITVSDGIVSALRKEASAAWIQTTAPVSPGNSGGPLLRMDGSVLGVITWGLMGGQNLNFAASSNEVTTLINKPYNAASLSSLSNGTLLNGANKEGLPRNVWTLWTSLSTAQDYKVRLDGDYLYIEGTNIKTSVYIYPEDSEAPAWARGELKKSGAKWVGQLREHLPIACKRKFFWTTLDVETEIIRLTPGRIEGRIQNVVDGSGCIVNGAPSWASFTWILKE